MEKFKKNNSYWNKFYKNSFIEIPTQFAVFVATYLKPPSTIIDLGCGNGRDTIFLSNNNFKVIGVDLSIGAINACNKKKQNNNLVFYCKDISDKNFIQTINKILKKKIFSSSKTVNYYSRFVMHSINKKQQVNFMLILKDLMKPGEKIFFEFRSRRDRNTKKIFQNHYRRYVDTNSFVKDLRQIANLKVLYKITGRGMALFGSEDPIVSRVVAVKN